MKIKQLEKYIEIKKQNEVCELCKGKGYMQEYKNKAVHTCWKCLKEGKLT